MIILIIFFIFNTVLCNKSSFRTYEGYQLVKDRACRKRRRIARKQQLTARPCEGNVELPVNNVAVFLKAVRCQEVELITPLYRKAVNNYIALRALTER